jgi:N6-adenosine-specific RNA methylase IME4
MSTALAHIDEASRMLAVARNIPDVAKVRDRAESIRMYLRHRGGCQDALVSASVLKVRAERRLGELLAEMPKSPGGRPAKNLSYRSTGFPSLPDLGISRDDSSRWQRVATITPEVFERHIGEAVAAKQEVSTAFFIRLAKDAVKPGRNGAPAQEESCTIDDLAGAAAAGKRFGTIYVDPPWPYDNQATRSSTDNHYRTMSMEDIAALPVADLAAEQSHLHLWTTNGFLEEALRLIPTWGFEYKSMFVWCKPQMGIGNYWRVSHELLLLGVRGGQVFKAKGLKSWAAIKRGRHSAKPEQVRLMIERASPGPRLELFGRAAVCGWTVWGDQIPRDLFHQEVACSERI